VSWPVIPGRCEASSRNLEIPGLVLTHHPGMTAAPPTVIARLDGAIQYSEASVIEPRSRGVLDTPHARGYDDRICGTPKCHKHAQWSYLGLTRVSIIFAKSIFRSGGIAGSSPAMTAAQLAASSRSSVNSRIAASASIGSPKAKPWAYSQPN
jgi:hypothetical protein